MFVVELFSVNDLRGHYSIGHFHSFTSKLLVPLTTPLMDSRILLSALKCITITVILDACRLACLLVCKPGIRTKDGIEIEAGYKRAAESIRFLRINFWENIITAQKSLS